MQSPPKAAPTPSKPVPSAAPSVTPAARAAGGAGAPASASASASGSALKTSARTPGSARLLTASGGPAGFLKPVGSGTSLAELTSLLVRVSRGARAQSCLPSSGSRNT